MQIAIDSIVAGKYQLETPLARGGMGSVWVARHVKLGSRIAVKFLDQRFATSKEFLDRFEREARAAAALQSPHVVHVQDYGVEEGIPYLVMELLQGEDLRARLNRQKKLSLAEAARILVQVGKALRKAHQAGIVHRDLKPGNLFLTKVDDDEVVKVLDFGIAKEGTLTDGDVTETGEVMGSPHYMSPEQARADKGIDHRADLWSLGVILYRAVTGALPFPGQAIGAVLSRILVDPVPAVATVAPDLPTTLDEFFKRALAKLKENRFQSVGEMADAFAQIAGVPPMSVTGYYSIVSASQSLEILPASRRAPESAPAPAAEPSGIESSGIESSGDQSSAVELSAEELEELQTLPKIHVTSSSSTGPGTLTKASMEKEPGPRPRRSGARWRMTGLLAALLIVGGALGWNQLRPRAPASSGEPSSSRAAPSEGAIAPAAPSLTHDGAATAAPATSETAAAPPASPAATPSASPTAGPSASGAPSGTAKAGAAGRGPNRGPRTPRTGGNQSEWGF